MPSVSCRKVTRSTPSLDAHVLMMLSSGMSVARMRRSFDAKVTEIAMTEPANTNLGFLGSSPQRISVEGKDRSLNLGFFGGELEWTASTVLATTFCVSDPQLSLCPERHASTVHVDALGVPTEQRRRPSEVRVSLPSEYLMHASPQLVSSYLSNLVMPRMGIA